MTYKNEAEYKSILGGILTILFRLAVLSYVIFQAKYLITRQATVVQRTIHNNLVMDNSTFALTNTNFDIAWRISGINDNEL